MKSMKILLTGFEPWGKHRRNPSGEAVKILGKKLGIECLVLPTKYREAERQLIKAVNKIKPQMLIMTGLATTRKKISLEVIALNVDHAEEKDNAGEKRWRKIISKGPCVLATMLPIDKLYSKLKKAKIPVTISYQAGTYVCNHVYYIVLSKFPHIKSIFVHVPQKPMNMIVKALLLLIREFK